MPTTTPNQVISALYVAAFNRAPDKAGLTFWQAQFTQNSAAAVQQLALNFTQHPAFTTLYGGLNNLDFVQAIYVNVLGGPGDAGGITFWNNLLASGSLTRSQFLAAFVESALTVDVNATTFPNLTQAERDAAIQRQDYLTNKADVGLYFANTLGPKSNLLSTTNPNSLASLLADPAYKAAIAILGGVTDDDSSVLAAETLVNTANATADPVGYINSHALTPPGDTFTLTTGVDIIHASSPNAVDIVKGVVDGDAGLDTGGATYTHGDVVNGNGHTIVQLAIQDGGNAAVASLIDVAKVNLVAGAIAPGAPPGAATATFDAVQWSNIGSVNLTDGVNGQHVNVVSLEDGTDLSIFSGVSGTISADYQSHLSVNLFAGEVSAISWIYGTDGKGDVDATVAASESATFTAHQDTGDVTVGDINATVAKSGFFGAFVSSSGSGDIIVGDVAITAETSATVTVSVSNTSGGSVTVGNVSMLGGFLEDLFIGNFSSTATGDVLVGNVSMSVSATSGSLFLDISNSGTTDQSLGSLKVGNVDLALARSATGSVTIDNFNAFSVDGLSLGALTVGNMAIDLGSHATLDVSITQSASGTTGLSLDTFGAVAIGNLSANLGIGATMSYDVFVGNFLSGDIASVKIGDVNLVLDDAASLSYSVSVTADKGDITSFVMGNVVVDMGVSASISEMFISLSANNGGNIGTVVIGDLSANVGTSSDFDDYTLSVFATSGTVGSVTVGNVSAVVDNSGSFSYSATVTGNDGVGAVKFGDFALTANDVGSMGVDLFVSAFSGDVGSVTVGDVSIAATGTVTAFFDITVSASGDAGVLNVGNISFDTTKDAFISMDIFSSGGLDSDINLGGVSFNGTDSFSYDGAILFISSTGNVSLGDISVGLSLTGITDVAPSLDLNNIFGTGLLDNVFSTGDISIASVNYDALKLSWAAGNPDAGNGVTIDLTHNGGVPVASLEYQGNTSVIGSDYNDTIFDNTGVNKLTGGLGADLFNMNLLSTGKTLATMDQILDFSNSAGDKLAVGIVPAPAFYDEAGPFATFSSFVTDANIADKDVFVGSVTGSGVIVAVDFDADSVVDYMIQLVGVGLGQIDIASFV